MRSNEGMRSYVALYKRIKTELDLIRWLQSKIHPSRRVPISIGEDAAFIVHAPSKGLLITTDMLLDGQHFILKKTHPELVGRKALAVNLSDIAAMGGTPLAAVVSIALPQHNGLNLAKQIFKGMLKLAKSFDVEIVGGDTNSWKKQLAISVTLMGETLEQKPVLRSGALPNDWIFVTGPLGGSLKQRHLTFTPRVFEAQELLRHANIHSMIDISDGLAIDLNRISEASGCGAVLYEDDIPIHSDVRRRSGHSIALNHALYDGEDFELLFTVSEQDGQKLIQSQPLSKFNVTLHHIGQCVKKGVWISAKNRPLQRLHVKGYLHQL